MMQTELYKCSQAILCWGGVGVLGSGFWIMQVESRDMKRRLPGYFRVKELFLPFFLGASGSVFYVPDQVVTLGDWKLMLS